MVKVPARSILPMVAFRDALCITHISVDGTKSQGREGPARFGDCARRSQEERMRAACRPSTSTATVPFVRFVLFVVKLPSLAAFP
jgi:hypothetical protein